MVFTDAQAITFLTAEPYLGLSLRTATALASEGIIMPGDFAEFDKDGLDAICRNLRKPARQLVGGVLADVEPYVFPARSQMRMYAYALAVKYYESVGRDIDPTNMIWAVVQHFHEEWKAILDKQKSDTPSSPKLTKGMPVYKWLESLMNHLAQLIGVRHAPLAYIVRDEAAVNPVPPALLAGEPFAEVYGSVEGEMIARLSHAHPLYKSDNGQVFDVIESALRGTALSPSIAQYRKTRDGRAAFLALKAQHAGRDVWDRIQRDAENKLQNLKWTGTTSMTLQGHMAMHRREFCSLLDCSGHIPVDVPNGRQRVTWLMNSITSLDPGILAALASIRQDEADKRVNFESAVAFLAPVCPVAAKQAKKGKLDGSANISGTSGALPGKGPVTGVELRYYKGREFMKLTDAQKKELKEWRANNPGAAKQAGGKRKSDSGGKPATAKKLKTLIASLTAENKEVIQALADSNSATVAAVAAGMGPSSRATIGATTMKPTDTQSDCLLTAQVAALKLQSILKKDDTKDKKKSD